MQRGHLPAAAQAPERAVWLAVRRVQDHIKKVKAEAREVQKELTRIERASLRELLGLIQGAREKAANLIKTADALETHTTTIANMAEAAIEGWQQHAAEEGADEAEALEVAAEPDD